MKILLLNASPRSTGSTVKMLQAIQAGISKEHQLEWVDVNQLHVKPCLGCLKCRPDKRCILPVDDGHRVGGVNSWGRFLNHRYSELLGKYSGTA